MSTKIRQSGLLAIAWVALALHTACDRPGTALGTNSNASCKAPDVSERLERALCTGDPQTIREALFYQDANPGDPERAKLLEVLRRLWEGDRSYGSGLPWAELESAQNRAVYVDYLSQGARNGEIDVPLSDMQTFAVDFARDAQDESDLLEGIRLIGLTNAGQQVPLLRSVALTEDWSHPSRRRHAIEALGYVCAPEAAAALHEIRQVIAGRNSEQEDVKKALATRERLSQSWCRENEPAH